MKILLFISLLTGGLTGAAQVVYQEGFYYTTGGAKYVGEIGRHDWHEPLSGFSFRTAGKASANVSLDTVEQVVIPGWEMFQHLHYGDWSFMAKPLVFCEEGISLYESVYGYFVTNPYRENGFEQLQIDGITTFYNSRIQYPAYLVQLARIFDTAYTQEIAWLLYSKHRWESLEDIVVRLNAMNGHHSDKAYRERHAAITITGGAGTGIYHTHMAGDGGDVGNLTFHSPGVKTAEINIERCDPWHSPKLTLIGGLQLFIAKVHAIGTTNFGYDYDRISLDYRQISLSIAGGAYYELFSLLGRKVRCRIGAKTGLMCNRYGTKHYSFYSTQSGHEVSGTGKVAFVGDALFLDVRIGILIAPLDLEITPFYQIPNLIAGTDSYVITQQMPGVTLSYRVHLSKQTVIPDYRIKHSCVE